MDKNKDKRNFLDEGKEIEKLLGNSKIQQEHSEIHMQEMQ